MRQNTKQQAIIHEAAENLAAENLDVIQENASEEDLASQLNES